MSTPSPSSSSPRLVSGEKYAAPPSQGHGTHIFVYCRLRLTVVAHRSGEAVAAEAHLVAQCGGEAAQIGVGERLIRRPDMALGVCLFLPDRIAAESRYSQTAKSRSFNLSPTSKLQFSRSAASSRLLLPGGPRPLAGRFLENHPYPPTKLQFNPRPAAPPLLASSPDTLRLWHSRSTTSSPPPRGRSSALSSTTGTPPAQGRAPPRPTRSTSGTHAPPPSTPPPHARRSPARPRTCSHATDS
ncbi:hypothetical protein EJB05_34500, partial [Eragrostis curvula]